MIDIITRVTLFGGCVFIFGFFITMGIWHLCKTLKKDKKD